MNSVTSNSLCLKYQRFPISGYKDIGSRKFEFVAKNKFLYLDIDFFLFSDAKKNLLMAFGTEPSQIVARTCLTYNFL